LAGGDVACLTKTDSLGDEEWSRSYGEIHATCMVQADEGGYIIVGYTDFANVSGILLVKTDSSGNSVWNKTYRGLYDEVAYSVTQTSDGGYAVTGYRHTDNPLPLVTDVYLLKTDALGNMEWEKTYYEGVTRHGLSVIQTSDGGYAIAGFASFKAFLVKTDSSGNEQWEKDYGSGSANFVIQTNDGGYALAGCTDDIHGYCPQLIKTDALGNPVWNQIYYVNERHLYDEAKCVIQTSDGGYALATSAHPGSTFGYDAHFIKTDSAGYQQWNITTYGASANAIIQTSDNGYAVAGSMDGAWLLRVSNGTALPVATLPPASTPKPTSVFYVDSTVITIAAGIVVVVVLAVACFLFYRRHRRNKQAQPDDRTKLY
jgi:hypothetical protein